MLSFNINEREELERDRADATLPGDTADHHGSAILPGSLFSLLLSIIQDCLPQFKEAPLSSRKMHIMKNHCTDFISFSVPKPNLGPAVVA